MSTVKWITHKQGLTALEDRCAGMSPSYGGASKYSAPLKTPLGPPLLRPFYFLSPFSSQARCSLQNPLDRGNGISLGVWDAVQEFGLYLRVAYSTWLKSGATNEVCRSLGSLADTGHQCFQESKPGSHSLQLPLQATEFLQLLLVTVCLVGHQGSVEM